MTRRMYEWIDPFQELEEMEHWIREREEEAQNRLHWALAEVGRHRAVVDGALLEAIQTYAPAIIGSQVNAATATSIMDTHIAKRLGRRL